ncbi:Glycerol-3-phosphate dehydrogenase 1 [Austwickia sp. TVS 96-490-7B]|uniref:glycerol-3-phosphate dehydrogenase/oxidase n=1 Tax=Austwickia sp. TVS 96-490-7B TaxID=2830843 RepID=UPI001C577F87|nr:glycerol-3-phosphate dehydrogenase/oxidase [Austwickia sp. TVS 96-490-7B]MBW3085485.1 Glycerol-3-phosphate dehydrogenase 1 [Austwickia sp. TVS 96-490-7B]
MTRHAAPDSLDAHTRTRALERLAEERYDVIVIGGGVTGAGVALDAASRGLRTALIEQVDLAAGTSRWSSKLAHGGLRYLATGNVGVAWESAMERHHLMTRIAPHLTRSTTYLVPLDANTGAAMGALTTAGVHVADAMRIAARTPAITLPRPRRINAAQVLHLAPGVRQQHLRGAVSYTDGQIEDDARLVIALARTASAHGADIITRCRASELTADSATLHDDLTGQSLTVHGHIISATGVWAGNHTPDLTILPSRGSHLIVHADAVGRPHAVFTAPVPGHFGRFVFAVPQTDDIVLIGLTDEEAPGVDGIAPPVPAAEEDFLIDTINRALERPLTHADILGRFAGLRPLVIPTTNTDDADQHSNHKPTSDVSRRHLLLDTPGAPITIAGGKLTTYRKMAQDAVDAVAKRIPNGSTVGGHTISPCRTTTLPLIGAAPHDVLAQIDAPTRLIRRYGTQATDVMALAQQHPEFATPVLPPTNGHQTPPMATIGAELLYGALHEGALTVDDLIERRTRLSFIEDGRAQATEVAERALALAADLQH